MKIRIKSTGEIKQALYDEEKHLFYYKEGNTTVYFLSGYEVISQDWEQRRFELVKAVSQAALHTEFRYELTEDLPKRIITFADAVLAEYRKEDNNEEK